jgi:2-isopropylmalate synthase
MPKDRVYLFDTTLRDGAQTIGTNFLLPDKRRIIAALDELGLDYVEAGFPGSNPVDTALFDDAPRLKRARLTAFGMTKRPGYSVSNDPGFQQVLRQAVGQVCIVAKSSEYHVRLALGISNDENLALIRDSLTAICAAGHEAYLNCEHFFTGYLANPIYGQEVVRTAMASGARWITLCDTNGGTLPSQIHRIVREVCQIAPGDHLGVHTHNDAELAVANSLAAIDAGCRLVHGTMNGLGERCGNANLTSLIPTLLLKEEYSSRFEIGVAPADLARLTEVSRLVDDVLGRAPDPQAPYVGADAFATKAGLHASAIRKEPATYEHIDPGLVGNRRRTVVASQAGRSNVLASLDRLNIPVAPEDDRVAALVERVKRDEAEGQAFDLGEASLDLRILDVFGAIGRSPLAVQEIVVRQRIGLQDGRGGIHMSVLGRPGGASKSLQIEVTGVDAFDASREALLAFYPDGSDEVMRLKTDLIELRSVDTGQDCRFRAVVQGCDPAQRRTWRTTGVGQTPGEAMLYALDDCLRYGMTFAFAPA